MCVLNEPQAVISALKVCGIAQFAGLLVQFEKTAHADYRP